MRSEVTAGQTLDLEAELAQSFLSEVDLPVLKRIFVTAAHQEGELIAISLEEVTEVEPVALRFVIGREASCCREVEPPVVAVDGVVELADLGVRYLIAFGPHHTGQHLEQGEGARQTPAGSAGEAAQNRGGVPWVGVPVREEPAIEDEDSAYVRPAHGFAPR